MMNPLIIAEVAQSHDGSFGNAKSFIDLAHTVGATAIKYQIHLADEESTKHEEWRVKFSEQDESRFAYWERMQFTLEQWKILRRYSKEKGLQFIVSTFSGLSVEIAHKLEADYIKIASGELTNIPMLEMISKGNIPVIISSGMSSLSEIESCIQLIGPNLVKGVLHCTTMYPTPLNEVGLNYMTKLSNKLDFNIGLSDHSGNPNVPIIAAYAGADIFELHLTFHELSFGPDVIASLTPEQFRLAVNGIADAKVLASSAINKAAQVNSLEGVKKVFARSAFLRDELHQGDTLKTENLCYKKPGGGMKWQEAISLVGKTAKQTISRETFLSGDLFLDD
jgi:N,N'-diacetyllegionaminate synthase